MNNKFFRVALLFVVFLIFNTFAHSVYSQQEAGILESKKLERYRAKVNDAQRIVLSNISIYTDKLKFYKDLESNDLLKYIVNFKINYNKYLDLDNYWKITSKKGLNKISDNFWNGMLKYIDEKTFKIKPEYYTSANNLQMAFEYKNKDIIVSHLKNFGFKKKSAESQISSDTYILTYGYRFNEKEWEELFKNLYNLKKESISKKEEKIADEAISFCKKRYNELTNRYKKFFKGKDYYFLRHVEADGHNQIKDKWLIITHAALNPNITGSDRITFTDLNAICSNFLKANNLINSFYLDGSKREFLLFMSPLFIGKESPLVLFECKYKSYQVDKPESWW